MIEKLVRKKDRQPQPTSNAPPTASRPVKKESRPQPKPNDALPHSEEAEKGILSSMLNDAGCIPSVHGQINGFYFVNPINRSLYEQLIRQWRDDQPTDFITLTQVLRDSGMLEKAGGVGNVTDLFTFVTTSANVAQYIEIVREKFLLREMISAGVTLARAAHGTDIDVQGMLDDFGQKLEKIRRAAGGVNGSERFDFADLMAFDSKHDPNCLVGNRYLVRGGSSLWAGGSGYGKSSLELQLAVYWACGVPCFGLRPMRPLRSLIIQAENDHGDMSEQLQGVFAGIHATGELDLEAREDIITKNVGIHRAIGKSGNAFLNLLDSLIEIDRPDFVWIDPLFAFAGCDLMNAEKAGHFLRDGLFPIAAKRMVALNVIHHVGKPVRDPGSKSTPAMPESDFQYLGFGTSEIQNAFRAVNILVPVKDTAMFRLVLSKRGERAGAKDLDGNWTRSVFLEHSKEGICWIQCEEPEKPKSTKNLKYTEEDILEEMSVVNGRGAKELQEHMKNDCGMSEKTFYRLWKDLKKDGRIEIDIENHLWTKKSANK